MYETDAGRYKPKDSYTEIWDEIYLKETLITD